MPDDPAFVRTIAASPDDDAPRLVYADVLDETGDPVHAARAEFIRVQVEKARLVPDTPRSRELWFREAALLDWAQQWRRELPAVPGVLYGGFLRGFIDRVEVHYDNRFTARAGDVFDAVPVRSLYLSGVAGDGPEKLVELDGLGRTVELYLFGPDVPKKLYEALIARGPWPNLERLGILCPPARQTPGRAELEDRLCEVFRGRLGWPRHMTMNFRLTTDSHSL